MLTLLVLNNDEAIKQHIKDSRLTFAHIARKMNVSRGYVIKIKEKMDGNN